MSSNDSKNYSQRQSRPSRANLAANDVDDLDYSEQAGPSNLSRHMASRSNPSSHYDPRKSISYHDFDAPNQSFLPSHPRMYPDDRRYPLASALAAPPRKTPSPEPDQDVLAYIRAQATDASISHPDQKLAEHLKKEKFQYGAGKVKSRVQKEREAEERKRKQAEQDAAKAYDEFVAAMQGDVDHANQTRPPKKSLGFVSAEGGAYVAPRAEQHPASSADTGHDSKEQHSKAYLKRVNNVFNDDQNSVDAEAAASAPHKEPQRKRHAAMSSFLTELQSQQAERESRLSTLASTTNKSISTLLAHETLTKSGSRDLISDPLTTNICIVTLPPNVDERSMGEFFCTFGDVATVKIMWPRGEQRERVGGLTGFVAYMTRGEAEYAFKQADGAMWGGVRIKLSWGKAMPLPTRAMYPMSLEKKGEDLPAQDHARDKAGKSNVSKLVIRHRTTTSKGDTRKELKQRVQNQYSETQRLFIETVASRIKSNGAHFEHILRDREADNPKFSFLHQQDSMLYHYFRICLDPYHIPLSLILDEQREFTDGGSDELYSTDSGEESENETLRFHRPSSSSSCNNSACLLGPLSRRRLICMLRGLTLRRERIARVTAFALDHASCYAWIVSILTTSLLQPKTPIPRKLARLYALSDLLHNSGAPISNAWRYRAALEAQLPLIFAHLGLVAKSFAGRMKREEFRTKVLRVLEIWEGWIVVGPHVLERVRNLFDNPPIVNVAKKGKQNDAQDLNAEAIDKIAPVVETQIEIRDAGKDEMDDEDLDGKALDDPAPLMRKGEQKQDEEEDLDGEALVETPLHPNTHTHVTSDQEEDLDGEAL
ncbi:uncharacterized protein MEPE_04045 [Melanopsichium pennsylvanicum]|uniref:U2 snRNP-associated SURP motif-containing protein n=2 Tax=Melanopsichium pennsylvanicum TaxID=63383 RepID=A0AAJ5C620_9BASI|nr:u2 snrnp-associated surp motif-containing protein [Melanopsichium pennsylvanicum 4]SNX85336.1 uncharacterized protein MEPE_04045 [Melanopsichium pennsylvanicum]